MGSIADMLARKQADPGLVKFAMNYHALTDLWNECPRVEWMLWLLKRVDARPRPQLRAFACWCARKYWSYLSDYRSRKAIEQAEKAAAGKCMAMELQMCREAAAVVAEELAREGDLVASRYAWLAWATTVEMPVDAAQEACRRAIEASTLSVALLGAPAVSASMLYAEQLRRTLGNPFVEMRPTLRPPTGFDAKYERRVNTTTHH